MSICTLGTEHKHLCFDCDIWFYEKYANTVMVYVDPGVAWQAYVCQNCHEANRDYRHENDEGKKMKKNKRLPSKKNIL